MLTGDVPSQSLGCRCMNIPARYCTGSGSGCPNLMGSGFGRSRGCRKEHYWALRAQQKGNLRTQHASAHTSSGPGGISGNPRTRHERLQLSAFPGLLWRRLPRVLIWGCWDVQRSQTEDEISIAADRFLLSPPNLRARLGRKTRGESARPRKPHSIGGP